MACLEPSRPFLWSHRIIPCTLPFSKGLPNLLFHMFDFQAPWHISYLLLVSASIDSQLAFKVFKLCPQIHLFWGLNNSSDHLQPTWQFWDVYLSSSSVSSSGSVFSTYSLFLQAAGSSSESPSLTTPPRSGSSNNFTSIKTNQKML